MSSLAFAVVRPGSETWAKEEVARARPAGASPTGGRPVALRYSERIARAIGPSLEGAVLTLEMNDARMIASIPSLLSRARELMPGAAVSAIQLPAHRTEIGVVVLRGRVAPGDRAARAPRGAGLRRAPRTR